MKQFIWDVNSDLIFITDNYEVVGPEDAYISGRYYDTDDGTKILLHSDDLTIPVNLDYFVRLWNSTYPDKEISGADISLSHLKTANSERKIYRVEKPIIKLDYETFPEFAEYMNSEGHIHPEADPDMMKQRNALVGRLGEMIFRNSHIPGLHLVDDPIHDPTHPNSPIDSFFQYDVGNGPQLFAGEIKASSSHNQRPYRYTITGYGAKSSNTAAQDKIGHISTWKDYSPASVGITMRYDDNMVDAYLMPHQIKSFSRSTTGAVPLIENMPFDFNGFHPSPYHSSRSPERRTHGVVVPYTPQPEPDLDEIFGPDPRQSK